MMIRKWNWRRRRRKIVMTTHSSLSKIIIFLRFTWPENLLPCPCGMATPSSLTSNPSWDQWQESKVICRSFLDSGSAMVTVLSDIAIMFCDMKETSFCNQKQVRDLKLGIHKCVVFAYMQCICGIFVVTCKIIIVEIKCTWVYRLYVHIYLTLHCTSCSFVFV